jgi:hypothetical protein
MVSGNQPILHLPEPLLSGYSVVNWFGILKFLALSDFSCRIIALEFQKCRLCHMSLKSGTTADDEFKAIFL